MILTNKRIQQLPGTKVLQLLGGRSYPELRTGKASAGSRTGLSPLQRLPGHRKASSSQGAGEGASAPTSALGQHGPATGSWGPDADSTVWSMDSVILWGGGMLQN